MQHNEFMNLKEDAKHGDFMLPFTVYGTWVPYSFISFPMHWHEEMEIIEIREGCLEVNVDLETYLVNEGDIIIIKPCTLHSFKQHLYSTMKSKSILFNVNTITNNLTDACSVKYINPFIENKYTYPVIITKECDGYDLIKNNIDEMIEVFEKKEEFFEIKIKEKLFQMFYILFKNFFVKENLGVNLKEDTIKNIKVVLDYIKENYMNTMSITELAELINLSDHYFMRFFKKYMGITCIDYINEYRLNMATNLLTTTDYSIMEIAVQVGIVNVSYFNRMFKRKFDVTPKEYRRRVKG